MNNKVARRRRQLQTVIPRESKEAMRAEIRAAATEQQTKITELTTQYNKTVQPINDNFKEAKVQARRDYERKRTEIIEKYEKEFGNVGAAQYAAAVMH